MKLFTRIGSIIFAIVSLAHLLRLLFNSEIIIGGWVAPMWISWVGMIIPGVLSVLLWYESKGPQAAQRPSE